MKFLTFDYKDSAGKNSARQAIEISAPQPHHFCIDVGELEAEEQALLMVELENLEKKIKQEREEILAKYDVSKNYRLFKSINITNLTEEE